MRYPLPEKIGNPDLLVGRAKEFAVFDKWLSRIPKKIGRSKVILARRKSGKTAIVQRIYNRLWNENGMIVPFYYNFPEAKIWYPDLAVAYYRSFASQYISFRERDEGPANTPLSLDEIKEYGRTKSVDLFVRDVDTILWGKREGLYGSAWTTAYSAPDRFASHYDQRILVILDEFQNVTQYVHHDQACEGAPDETLAGSFHDVVESKIAPMLVTGSYVGWLVSVIDKYLEAGRLKRHFMAPYLAPEEGLQAVYKYAEILEEPITNETADQINRLCMSDPFFISCVVESECPEKDLTTAKGVIETVNYEITDESSQMSMTWGEYIELTLKKVNDRYAKRMLLHLSKHADLELTPRMLREKLGLDISENEIREKLEIMVKADVLKKGGSDIRYKGLQDGTLNLILRHRFEDEINDFIPDLKKEFADEIATLKKDRNALRGRLSHLIGKFAEFQLFTEFRSRKRFGLSAYFDGVKETEMLNITDVRMRETFRRADGKTLEIDVLAASDCGRVVLTEIKKTKNKTGIGIIRQFHEKTAAFAQRFPEKKVIPAFLSVGGFTRDAKKFCEQHGIGTAETINYQFSKG